MKEGEKGRVKGMWRKMKKGGWKEGEGRWRIKDERKVEEGKRGGK